MSSYQTPLAQRPPDAPNKFIPIHKCHQIWNVRIARFTPCFLPYVAAIPAILAVLILLTYALRLFRKHRPQWTKPLIVETKEDLVDVRPADCPPRSTRAVFGLMAIAATGLTFQALSMFFPARDYNALWPTVAWAILATIVMFERPKKASLSMLVLFSGLLFSNAVELSHSETTQRRKEFPALLALVASITGIVVILNMPLRDPELPDKDISPVYSKPTGDQRTPEDNLTPWQYMTVVWVNPLIKKGVTREMNDNDVWDLGYEFKHARLHDAFRQLHGSVTRRVFVANGMDLIRATFLNGTRLITTLLAPVILQRILVSMKDPLAPVSATITYALIGLALRLLSAQLFVFNLWIERRAYERSRGQLITMLYEKTLNRKILGAKQKTPSNSANGGQQTAENGNGDGHDQNGHEQTKKVPRTWHQQIRDVLRNLFGRRNKETARKADNEDGPASTGKILNLMRNDAYEVAQRMWDFNDILLKPAGAVFSVLLIWRMLGWACLLGVLALGVSQVLNIGIARITVYFEKKRRATSDEKLQRSTQFIESIRHLRWYGWQDAWLESIFESREKELRLRIILIFLNTTLAFVLRFGSGLFPAVAFYAFTSLAGKPLPVELIFPAFDLFKLLENYLRDFPRLVQSTLNGYVSMVRLEKFMSEPDKEQAELTSEATSTLSLSNASFAWPGVETNVLEDLTLAFPSGLTVIYGEVAAGKTALLQALLGELDKTSGVFIQPDQVIGYCSQTPWLQSMSIRDNIIFSYPYDEIRYKQVLDACALLPDMAELKHGDLSNIGENGIGLSGGQKARVALARAIYSHAKIVFLDDPLSALDHQTAASIVRKLLAGPLLEDRTTVLVTHRTELCHGLAKQWVQVDHGRISFHEPTRLDESNGLQRTHTNDSMTEEEAKKREEEQAAAIPDKFIDDEHRAKGGVAWHVYWRYIKAGTLRWWSTVIVVMAIFRAIDVGQGWLVKEWGESYDHGKPKGIFGFLPPVQEDVIAWIGTFFVFVTITAVLYWVTNLIMYGVGYHAAKTIFKEAMTRVSRATFRYYDITPVGRLMNRITSDMNTIDGDLSNVFTVFAWQFIGWITSVIIILSATPTFLAFGICLFCGFVYFYLRYLPTSQTLRRLEMVSLSPLMSNFGTLVEGLTTVRAFNAQSRFQSSVIKVVDTFQKNDHFYWSVQSWLTLRFSFMSASSTFVMVVIAVYTGVSTGLTAFVLIAANRFVDHTEWMCRCYGQMEMDFTSVERVVELLDIDVEDPGVVDPPAHWPTYTGDIEFNNVTIRYAPHLEPALRNVTLKIPAGSNTAVIGRTGSGKSTLALSLLSTMAIEDGTILIDGVDVSTVNKQALRSRVTFLAQEPVLFPGTMRKNLDPLNEYSDAACESVLAKIAGNHKWTLTTNIEGGGKGLSQGQRQLVGLARAMLRNSPVLIMDEATASIDFETAQRIQSVLREEMKNSTVITIAHRLEAVKNADYCVVLGKGKLIKAGKAEDMLREGSEFSEMLA